MGSQGGAGQGLLLCSLAAGYAYMTAQLPELQPYLSKPTLFGLVREELVSEKVADPLAF